MWMSEARSAIAWVMRRLTSLTMGDSSVISRTLDRSVSASKVLEASADMFSASLSRRWYLATAARIDARVATAIRISAPVTVRMSSTANTFDGSAIATMRRPSSHPIGRARYRLAMESLIRRAAAASTGYSARSTYSSFRWAARVATRSDSETRSSSMRMRGRLSPRCVRAARAAWSFSSLSSPPARRSAPRRSSSVGGTDFPTVAAGIVMAQPRYDRTDDRNLSRRPRLIGSSPGATGSSSTFSLAVSSPSTP